jgi:hypothetical protein
MRISLLFACIQSHNREVPAVGDFYGTGIEIWAVYGLVGITEK